MGFFHLLHSMTNGATVPFIDLPDSVRVKDFKILDDHIFFVGTTTSNKALFGIFDISGVFYSGFNIKLGTLSSFSYICTGIPYQAFPLELSKMEVYMHNNDYHIIAIGEADEVPSNTSKKEPSKNMRNKGIYDIVYSPFSSSVSYNVLPSYDGCIITDVIQTDNYIVSLAHKGNINDLSAPGYIMMHPFDKSATPLQNPSGYMLHHIDTYPNGYIMGTGTGNDNFVVTCCSPDPSNPFTLTQQDILSFTVNSGVILPLTKKSTNFQSFSNYTTIRDMAYNSKTNHVCDIDDFMTSTTTLTIHTPSTYFIDKLTPNNTKLSSVCSMTTADCAVSGQNLSGLYILVQSLPPQISCEPISTYPLTQQSISIISGGNYCLDSRLFKLRDYTPQKNLSAFVVDCKL